jgi:hypothetical protein
MEKTKREWVRGLTVCLRIKCATVKDGVRASFRLPEKNGEPLEFVALNGIDQTGMAYDIEVGDRKPFETFKVKDRMQGGIVVDFVPPKVDQWVTFTNAKMSVDVDSYGKKKLGIDSVFQMRVDDDGAGDMSPKPAARRRVRSAT